MPDKVVISMSVDLLPIQPMRQTDPEIFNASSHVKPRLDCSCSTLTGVVGQHNLEMLLSLVKKVFKSQWWIVSLVLKPQPRDKIWRVPFV